MRFDADLLETLGALLLVKGGMTERAAATVASHVMGNALRGVDSHGVVRFAQYREQIVEGIFDPAGEATVTPSDDGLIRVDGGGGHGHAAVETVVGHYRDVGTRKYLDLE